MGESDIVLEGDISDPSRPGWVAPEGNTVVVPEPETLVVEG